MPFRWVFTILFGLLVIGIGMQPSVAAKAFQPTEFVYCLATGGLAIGAGYLLHADRRRLGSSLALASIFAVLGYYVFCFVTQPNPDATLRVALAVLASIGEFCVITLPERDRPSASAEGAIELLRRR